MVERKRANKQFYTVHFVWDKRLWVITFAIFALWLGVAGFLFYNIFTQENSTEPLIALLLFNAIMLPLVLACEGYAPQRWEIGEGKIVVLRRYKSVVITREEIKSVERLPANAMRGAIRTAGVGGLFGYYGSYYSRSIGSFKLYATSFDNLFLVRKWDGKCVVISCAEPDKMEIYL